MNVPSRSETTPRQVSVDFMKLREPVVVTHDTASLPILVPAASMSGFAHRRVLAVIAYLRAADPSARHGA